MSFIYNKLSKVGHVNVLPLKGTYADMGTVYGKEMNESLSSTLQIVRDYYVTQKNIPYNKIVEAAETLYDKFPLKFQDFIQGMAEGSGLSLNECKVLNAMETLGSLEDPTDTNACAFMFIPPQNTNTKSGIMARNYDYPEPFEKTAQYLTVTMLDDGDSVPTAFISMPGQVYCPSCINSVGLFMELNNGMPSGGYETLQHDETMLAKMLSILQNSHSLEQANTQLRSTLSDLSLIINVANATHVGSHEYSTALSKAYDEVLNTKFVSTNYYLNDNWQDIPEPTDSTTWLGITRHDNLYTQNAQNETFSTPEVLELMDKDINEGGAHWQYTIYQMVYDEDNLYLKIPHTSDDWYSIQLEELFAPSTASNEGFDYIHEEL